ncbi:MAG: DinB family protein [Chloroflexi bacterium]|nr:DinB family protein [Chloroflexota bacterium]
MTDSIMAEISDRYRTNQENLLELVSGLSGEQIAWTPNETTPSVGFHVWHLARWADYLQELIHGRGSQLWEIEGLAARWNMETKSLGYAQTGMEMDGSSAAALRMPEKGALLDYARRSFAAAQAAVAKIGDNEFFAVYEGLHGENWHDGQIGPIVITWMTHDNRHLGMVECLVGLQGQSGSADA